MSDLNINGAQSVYASSVSGLDIETALMAVQSHRASLLEGQLSTQLADVQKRNTEISKLNHAVSMARTLSSNAGTDSTTVITTKTPGYQEFYDAAIEAGISNSDVSQLRSVGLLTTAIENYKSMIDSQSNSQQMDMLRLQSLSNKRNEAFEIMTNFMKKMQDNRSAVISNMR